MRQPSKKSSRVPRYQKGRRIDGFCNPSVKTPHIGGGLVGGGCLFASFSAPEKVRENVIQRLTRALVKRFNLFFALLCHFF